MDWAKAIEINHAALLRIVAALVTMAGVAERLPQPVYRAILRILRPAESAVRRLIVIAARGIVVKPSAFRPMPKGLAFAGTGGGRAAFPLFDPRKRFAPHGRGKAFAKHGPRISVFGPSPLVPLFHPRPAPSPAPAPEPGGLVGALRLNRRLAALKLALDDLPRQARRLARWQARRDRMASPKFTSPLRPGPPPGHRKKPGDEIDLILRECHGLARDAAIENSS